MDNTKLIEPIEVALKMETDGWNFYMQSAEKASNKLIKDMLLSLAKDEENHMCIFNNIYESLNKFKRLPDDIFVAAPQNVESVFDVNKSENIGSISNSRSDLDIIKVAQDMENKSIVYYTNLSTTMLESKMRVFFEKLVVVEKQHYDILTNTYAYLNSQIDWYTKTEKPSFEG